MSHNQSHCFVACVLQEEASNHLTSCGKLLSLVKTEAEVYRPHLKDKPFRRRLGKMLGLRDVSVHHLVRDLVTFHVGRGMQVFSCIHDALSIDGPLPRGPLVAAPNTEDGDFVIWMAMLDCGGLLLKWVKETSAYVAARCFQQDETNEASMKDLYNQIVETYGKAPMSAGVLGPGKYARASRYLMAPRKSLRTPFGQRIMRMGENALYIKRACPPMTVFQIEAELEKHKTRVCRPVQEGPRTGAAAKVRGLTKEAIRQITKSVFGNAMFDPMAAFPALSASYTNNRRKGGQLGQLFHEFAAWDKTTLCVDPKDGSKLWNKTRSESSYLGEPTLSSMREVSPGKVVELKALPSVQHRLDRFLQFIKERLNEDYAAWEGGERLFAKPFPICEPCKVRVITMGEDVPYYGLLSVQKFLWSKLSNYPTFEFTGKPIGDDWTGVWDPNDSENAASLKSSSFVSGDFSAATDNLDPELSEFTWECIARLARVKCDPTSDIEAYINGVAGSEKKCVGSTSLIDSPWYGFVRKGLTGHKLDYPESANCREGNYEQTWGQLMGSPVSFPILNIVNAATTAVSLWLYDTKCWTSSGLPDCRKFDAVALLKSSHCRTNGDDLFFVCPDGAYDIWKDTVTQAGLQPSIGKNYLSKDFCVINSELRVLTRAAGPSSGGGARPWSWRYETFCNLPIVYGMEAKGPRAGQSVLERLCWWELSALAHSLVRGIDPSDPRYHGRLVEFERHHKPVLSRVPPGVDYHVPMGVGGVGIPAHDCGEQINQLAQARATWLMCLDAKSRAKALAPPPRPRTSVWDEMIGAAQKSQQGWRLSQTKRVSDDPLLPPRLAAADLKCGDDFLANALKFQDDVLDSFATEPDVFESLVNVPENSTPLKSQIEVQYCSLAHLSFVEWTKKGTRVRQRFGWENETNFAPDDNGVVSQRETRYLHQLMRQLKKARAALSSGKVRFASRETIQLWKGVDSLQEIDLHPKYDRPIHL